MICPDDLKPGDRVAVRCRQSRRGDVTISMTFERIVDATTLAHEIARPGTLALMGDWRRVLTSGRRIAVFRIGIVHGLFEIHPDTTMRDDEGREVTIEAVMESRPS